MVTATSPLARQPDKLDYASPTQFKFGIHQLPKFKLGWACIIQFIWLSCKWWCCCYH